MPRLFQSVMFVAPLVAAFHSLALVPECLDAADFDDNGDADISDAIANLGFQFLGGPGPASPGSQACGEDVRLETPDLGCKVGC